MAGMKGEPLWRPCGPALLGILKIGRPFDNAVPSYFLHGGPSVAEVRKTFEYRLYPTPTQEQTLLWWLRRARELYNAALVERRDAYRSQKVAVNRHAQITQLPALKADGCRPEYRAINSQVLQDVVERLDRAYAAFFRRVKKGDTPGYPRLKSTSRYRSFTLKTSGWKLGDPTDQKGRRCRLKIGGVGPIRLILSRPIEGTVKTVTIRNNGDQWFAAFSCVCEVAPDPEAANRPPVGIDVGLETFATLSDGTVIENPRWFRRTAAVLAHRQRRLARWGTRPKTVKAENGKRSSWGKNRRKASAAVRRTHRTIKNQRKDFHHKTSRTLVDTYGVIAVENLTIASMMRRPTPKLDDEKTQETGQPRYAPNGAAAKSGLNKSIGDAGWGQFTDMLAIKAEWAGSGVVRVNPAGTSQMCSGCERDVHKTLEDRWHLCPYCGLSLSRDHNAARNIQLRAGLVPYDSVHSGAVVA